MKPAPFGYLRPASIDEVVAVLAEHGSRAAVLAGGQSLLPLLNQREVRPAIVVDLAGVAELRRVEIGVDRVELGALVGQRLSATVAAALPLLALALPHVGHVQTRNRGTIAGSVANGDPLAEIPLALLVAGGEVELASVRGRRVISIDDFLGRALAPNHRADELVVATRWARPGPGSGHAFLELASGLGGSTVAAAAAKVVVEGGRVVSARLGVAGSQDGPVVVEQAERVAVAEREAVERFGRRLATALVDGVGFIDDAASDPDHRRAVAIELAVRALVAATVEAATSALDPADPVDALDPVEPRERVGGGASAAQIDSGEAVPVTLSVDGRELTAMVEARTSLADAVRAAGVTGVKLGCEQGVCGSCTVLIGQTSQRSCLVFAVQAEGVEVTTSAGLQGAIDELRAAFVDHFAVQCGFCASGVLVTAAAELAEREQAGTLGDLDTEAITGLLSGNVCRCTGYGSMVAAIGQAARRLADRSGIF